MDPCMAKAFNKKVGDLTKVRISMLPSAEAILPHTLLMSNSL